MLNISNEEYRKKEGISSSVLKKILISEAHLEHVLKHGWPKSDATTLGDAVHAALIEPNRFKDMYKLETDTYKRAYGQFKAGDPKLDEDGNPIQQFTHVSNPDMDIKGEQFKKLIAICCAASDCPELTRILAGKYNVEASFFTKYEDGRIIKVRCDFMYKDPEGHVWIVDLKTVGGSREKPSAPEHFSTNMFDLGYDLQSYMYTEVIKQEIPEVYGFMFICLDAKVPSGVKIYKIVPGESEWYELGGYRFRDAMERMKKFEQNKTHLAYNNVSEEDLNLSFQAASALAMYKEGL